MCECKYANRLQFLKIGKRNTLECIPVEIVKIQRVLFYILMFECNSTNRLVLP